MLKNTPRAVQASQPSNPKRSKAKRTRKNRVRNDRTLMRSNVAMKPCSLHYMQAVLDPFNYRLSGKEVCIPDLWDLPSFKFSTRVRGTFITGATAGGVVISPFTFSNDEVFGFVSLSPYGGNVMPGTADVGVSSFEDSQFPWGVDFPRQVRLVACGLRARYIGTQLNLGGQILPVAICTAEGNVVHLDSNQISNMNNTEQYPSSRAWHGCCWRPTTQDQMSYIFGSFPASSNSNCKMGILCIPATANQPFEYEVVRFFEAVSQSATSGSGSSSNSVPSTTASDSDIVGLSTVRQFLGSVSNSEVGQTLWSKGAKYLTAAASQAAASYFGGPLAITYPSVIEL